LRLLDINADRASGDMGEPYFFLIVLVAPKLQEFFNKKTNMDIISIPFELSDRVRFPFLQFKEGTS